MCQKFYVMVFRRYVSNVSYIQKNIFLKNLRDRKQLFKTSSVPFSSTPNGAFFKDNKTILISVIAASSAVLGYSYFTKYSQKSEPVVKEDQKKISEVKFVEPYLEEKLALLKDYGKIPYIIVGAGTAASAAFRSIRANDPYSKILIIGEEPYYPYMRPPLSKDLWFSNNPALLERLIFKQWSGKERSVFFEPDVFYCPIEDLLLRKNGGVSILRGVKVVRIDPDQKTVHLENGTSLSYEKCLLVPGGKPKNLPVFINTSDDVKQHVSLFRTAEDFKALYKLLPNIKSVTIIGGGFLGTELACALGKVGKQTGLEVNQLFPEAGVLNKILPEYLSNYSTEKVRSEGVIVTPNVTVNTVVKSNDKIKLTLSTGKEINTDHVIVAVGLEPNVDLAKSARLEIDKENGGFLVNAELEARKDLWVAGDAMSFYDEKLGRRRVEHHDHALVSGRLAGANMSAKPKPLQYQSMFWSDLGPEIGFEAIGILDSSLRTVGIFAKRTENIKSEEEISKPANDKMVSPSEQNDEFNKGVIFYIRDQVIVGILLWNVFGQMPVARKIINEVLSPDDLVEAGKLFNFNYSGEEN